MTGDKKGSDLPEPRVFYLTDVGMNAIRKNGTANVGLWSNSIGAPHRVLIYPLAPLEPDWGEMVRIRDGSGRHKTTGYGIFGSGRRFVHLAGSGSFFAHHIIRDTPPSQPSDLEALAVEAARLAGGRFVRDEE